MNEITQQDADYGPLLATIMGIFDTVENSHKDGIITQSTDPFFDLNKYIELRIALARAFPKMTVTSRTELTSLADQLDRTLTAAETLRYKAQYCS